MSALALTLGAVALHGFGGLLGAAGRGGRIVSWMPRMVSIWLLAGSVGTFYPLWMVLPFGLAGAALEWRGPRPVSATAVDLGHVLVASRLSAPALELLPTLILILLALGVAVLLEAVRVAASIARDRMASRSPAALRRVTVSLVIVLIGAPGLLYGSSERIRAMLVEPVEIANDLGWDTFLFAGLRSPLSATRVDLETGSVAWLNRRGEPGRPGVLFLHGADRRGARQPAGDAVRRALLEAGLTVLSVDHPGYGASPLPGKIEDPEAWDPLPSLLAAIRRLQAETGSRGFFAVGHSMGSSDVLRLAAVHDDLLAGFLLGARTRESSERESYWHERFRTDRGMEDSIPLAVFRDLWSSYYDNAALASDLPGGHPDLVFVRFGVEHENIVETRDDLYRMLPGDKQAWDLDGVTHYLSTYSAPFDTYLGDYSAVVELADRVEAYVDGFTDRVADQWETVEWTVENPDHSGNPFDLSGRVVFSHEESGERRETGMFFDGSTWRFRFTATRPGAWRFETRSDDSDLDGRTGVIRVTPTSGRGFVEASGHHWTFSGTETAFVPQYVMYAGPHYFYGRRERVREDVRRYLTSGGFNGFHVPVFCRWFDISRASCADLGDDPNPDPRTFEALEMLIREVHAAGGVVHLWMWGDEQRRMTPVRWGKNGTVDRRLQDYIAARLGPIPGWTMGYGFDLWEWTEAEDLERWHSRLHQRMGWPHLLGGRGPMNRLDQIYEGLDYAGYEQHRPDYFTYRRTLMARPHKPTLSEDRFRIREESGRRPKDYTPPDVVRGMWASTMAGGVGNIWGNLVGVEGGSLGEEPSSLFPNQDEIRTYSEFFDGRFQVGLEPCNTRTDGVCLGREDEDFYLFYKEDASSIEMVLEGMSEAHSAVAVDTRSAYEEIPVGIIEPGTRTWVPPYPSDWAVAVGEASSGSGRVGR